MVVVLTGVVPIRADLRTFAVAFISTFLLQQLALKALSRGSHRPILSVVFELVRMTSNLRATLSLVTRRRPSFVVTPKGRQGDGRRRVRVPRLLGALLLGSVAAAAWFALTLLGETPVTYAEPGAVLAAFGWMLFNVGLVCLAIVRIRSLRYAPERRASVRFDVELPALVDGLTAETRDVSTAGAKVIVGTELAAGTEVDLSLDTDGPPVVLRAVVRSVRRNPGGGLVHGLEFRPGQHEARARLALLLFHQQPAPVVDRSLGPTRTRDLVPAAA